MAPFLEKLATQFKHIDNTFFKDSANHVVGNQLTLADVALGLALSQLTLAKYEVSAFPKIAAFWQHLQTVEAFKKSHAAFFAISTPILSGAK